MFDAHQRDHTQIIVKPRVDDQRLQRCARVTFRRRNAFNQRLQQVGDTEPGLGTDQHGAVRLDANDVFDFIDHALGLTLRQVDFVEHRHHFQTLLERRVAIRHALRFDTL